MNSINQGKKTTNELYYLSTMYKIVSLCEDLENDNSQTKKDILLHKTLLEHTKMKYQKLESKFQDIEKRLDRVEKQKKLRQFESEVYKAFESQTKFTSDLHHESKHEIEKYYNYNIQYTSEMNNKLMTRTSQLFDKLYGQIHDCVGVTNVHDIKKIREQIKKHLIHPEYEYFNK